MSQWKVGNLARSGSKASKLEPGSKGLQISQAKEKEPAGYAVHQMPVARIRSSMLSRAVRVKVWEERIDEVDEREDEEEQEPRDAEKEERFSSGSCTITRSSNLQHLRAQKPPSDAGVGCNQTKSGVSRVEEIGVFDAERYFGGADQQSAAAAQGWAREEEDELLDGEAGGDLPLSPLVELGKGKWRWRSDAEEGDHRSGSGSAGGDQALWGGRRRMHSSEFTSPRTSTASSLSEVEPLPRRLVYRSSAVARNINNPSLMPSVSRSNAAAAAAAVAGSAGIDQKSALSVGNKSIKAQPASPSSSRLANFLAKFKAAASSPRKSSTACSSSRIQPLKSSSLPPPLSSSGLSPSPAKELFPHNSLYSFGSAHAHANIKFSSSPRGRILRAFSSSSADNCNGASSATATSPSPGLFSNTSARHKVAGARTPPPKQPVASSPVSPAACSAPDVYSPVAHSASATPISSRLHTHSYLQRHAGSFDSHNNACSLRRTGPADSAAQTSRGNSSGRFKQQLPSLSRKLKVYLMPDKAATGNVGDLARAGKKGEGSQGRNDDFVPPHIRCTAQAQGPKQRRRWLHADDQVVDEDIELAERLLRVVQDHQSVDHINHTSKFNLLSQAIRSHSSGNVDKYMKTFHVDRVTEYSTRKYDQMHPTTFTATSNLVPRVCNGASGQFGGGKAANGPPLHYLMRNPDLQLQLPAAATKIAEESSQVQQLQYDSDSSSDLFEIETTLASSVQGLGSLYSRRDLPVYEVAKAQGPLPGGHFSFASSAAAR